MKKTLQKFVTRLLGRQVRALRARHEFKVVAVVGGAESGVGKTVAQVLDETAHARYHPAGRSEHEVLLQFFGVNAPKLFNIFAWAGVLIHNSKQIRGTYPYKAVVLESPDGIMGLQKYVDFDAVLQPAEKSLQVPGGRISYDIAAGENDFHMANIFAVPGGFEADIKHEGEIYLHVSLKAATETALLTPLAAIIAARELGYKTPQIQAGLAALQRPPKEAGA